MRRTEQRQGLRMLKLRDVLSRWEAAELSQLEAAELLGMSERTFRRWARRFEEDGEAGLADRRLGRRSGRAVPDAAAEEVERLYRERYGGFTAKHFHDHLVDQHKFAWGYTWTKSFLQSVVCWPKRRGVGRIGASGRVGRWSGCCCTRTGRGMPGWPGSAPWTW